MCTNTCQLVLMHDDECLGVLGNHKGELVQSAWKRMNKSVFQGVLVNSRFPMDEVCWENFIIGLAGGKPKITIRDGRNTREHYLTMHGNE